MVLTRQRPILLFWVFVLLHSPAGSNFEGRVCATERRPQIEEHVIRFRNVGVIVVRARVNDQPPGWFVVDTGCSFHVLDSKYRELLGAPVDKLLTSTTTRSVRLLSFVTPTIKLSKHPSGSFDLKTKANVLLHDFASVSQAIGIPIDGFLGIDIFKDRLVSIDFDPPEMRFTSNSTIQGAKSRLGIAFPILRKKNGLCELPVMLNGKRELFAIDTGSNQSLSLRHERFQELIESEQMSAIRKTWAINALGPVITEGGRLKSLRLGPFVHNNLQVSAAKKNRLGLDYLRRYRVSLDISNATVYLAKGSHFSYPEPEDRSGLKLYHLDDGITVDVVERYSPAAAADIQVGDVIRKLNGRDLKGEGLYHLRRVLRGLNGTAVRLTILRQNRLIEKRLKLIDYDLWWQLSAPTAAETTTEPNGQKATEGALTPTNESE